MERIREDISTIGFEQDNDSSVFSHSLTYDGDGNNDMGDLDDEDVAADRAKYFEENALVIDGFKCPDEFLNIITPMEFEEMVNLFTRFDANKSGSIDVHETKKILHFLGMDFSLHKAEELLAVVDTDKSGEIDFAEFCGFIVMIKRGDERLTGFHTLIEKMNSTPLGELERQARNRDFKLRFRVVEIREASLTNPTLFVVELEIAGTWFNVEKSEITPYYNIRKFQGMGNTIREAKYSAASAALVNLGDSMPGVRFKPGDFPEEWLEWVDENLLRGVDAGKIVSILSSKGFHPHRNVRLMHRILAWQSLIHFLEAHPGIDLVSDDENETLHPEFREWIRNTAKKGIDGTVLVKLLADRCLDLKKVDLYFAQQLANNELGSLMGGRTGSEVTANILDFHVACRYGYLEDVLIYCKCGSAVNEEKLDRHTCERVRPLAYAAYGGHCDVIRTLLQYGASVNHVDRRGRGAIHIAALRGHRDAIAVLIDFGAKMFSMDMHGNTPLHLAALCNHYDCVDFLAFKGQELARTICSDKIRVKEGGTFEGLVEEVFVKLPAGKLKINDTVRFEKKWLHDAAIMLVKLCDANVRFMLPRSCPEIMEDVLLRFDPRAETGIFVQNDITGEQTFILTINTPKDLAHLLRYVYRQACIDSVNRWRRTALHMACDANIVHSHQRIILRLIDDYGCNVNLKDMHTRRAIDLLIMDKIVPGKPSATQAREEIIIDKRQAELDRMFSIFAEEERQKTAQRRATILHECIEREEKMEFRLWECTREASILKRKFADDWEMYEDPDTGNYFYVKAPPKMIYAGDYSQHNWTEPVLAKTIIDRTNGLHFLRVVSSVLLRVCGPWEVYRENTTLIEYYYNTTTQQLKFSPPPELTWKSILKHSKNTYVKLGYANEWEVMTDMHQNTFYRNKISKHCEYDQPVDAVTVTPAEMLCTSYQFKDKPGIMQKWYSCEQCYRQWKLANAERSLALANNTSSSAQSPGQAQGQGQGQQAAVASATKAFLICEPCISRCHHKHKGIRFLYEIASSRTVYCMCVESSRVTQQMCCAMNISEKQMNIQNDADKQRQELTRQRQRNIDFPPIFACVPRISRINTMKTLSGWRLCRQCQPPHKLKAKRALGEGSASLVEENNSLLFVDNASSTANDSTIGDHDDDLDDTDNSEDEDDDESQSQSQPQSSIADGGMSLASSQQRLTTNNNINLDDFHDLGWVEVFDVEQPEELKYGDSVLCEPYRGVPRLYGKIKSQPRPGFYLIRYDNRDLGEELLDRSRLELLSRVKFHFNTVTGECCWAKDDYDNAFPSQAMTLSGMEWAEILRKSTIRRSFDDYDELYSEGLNQVFYMHVPTYEIEKAAIRLQNNFRVKFQRSRPFQAWRSKAYSFDIPQSVHELMKEKAGWAYLRRRAQSIGDFLDKDGVEWEEYIDNKTSEYFYWTEEENLYQWTKPEAYQRPVAPQNKYALNEEVLFRFPGRRTEEIAIITKVRFDDETGEDMYDLVHKLSAETTYKWIPRIAIKNIPLEGEELMLAKFEQKWKNQIKRRREAEDRKHQREKELRVAAEMARLEEMKSLAYRLGKSNPSDGSNDGVSLSTRLMRGRMDRITLEAKIIREEIDMQEGQNRRDRVQAEVDEMKNQLGHRVTRAAVLNMQRSLELKFLLEEKVLKRNKLREELDQRKLEARQRVQYVEDTLREQETGVTTPRSVYRRKIIRRTHIAMKRQSDGFLICEWGCGDWFRMGVEQQDHQARRCIKRILPCPLNCGVKHTEEWWLLPHEDGVNTNEDEVFSLISHAPGSDMMSLGSHSTRSHARRKKKALATAAVGNATAAVTTSNNNHADDESTLHDNDNDTHSLQSVGTVQRVTSNAVGEITNQQHHETQECIKRLVMCPLHCLEWVSAEVLDHHLKELCTKRPAKPLPCRLGCGELFGGIVEMLIQAEDDRLQHENENCIYRIVRCNWVFEDGKVCAAQMKATEREAHRDQHLTALGVLNYGVPGVYTFRTTKKLTRLKLQLWGAGGGSGFFKDRQGGSGGGGAFVEAIVDLEPYTTLELTVGSGGQAGIVGKEMQVGDLHEQRRVAAEWRQRQADLPKGEILPWDPNMLPGATNGYCGVTPGGLPGGGIGYGGGGAWACGSGGGYTSIAKRSAKGAQVLLLAAGGGGAGSIDGLPGGALEGSLPGTLLDPLNGSTATVDKPGRPGETGSTFNSAWNGTSGDMWQGGNGCEFGAGGGAGYYGGGGGGTSPGIAGSGGGGSSYYYSKIIRDIVIMGGHGIEPGGLQHDPPLACGLGEWDKTGGFAGKGGRGDRTMTSPGNNGAIRIIKPGHY